MNWKLISVVALGGAQVMLSAVNIASKAYLRKTAKVKAVDIRPEEETEILRKAKDELEAYANLKKTEEKGMANLVDAWKKDTRYDDRKRDIYQALEDEVAQFKTSIGYETKKQAAIDTCENELAAFKESIEYDTKISELEGKISEARKAFEDKSKIADIWSDGSTTTFASEAKLQAEKEKNKIVAEAESKIKELKAQVDTKKKALEKVKQNDIQKLESQVLNEKTRLQKSTNAELDKLEKELATAKDEFSRDIAEMRTDADREAIRRHNENWETVKEQSFTDARRAADICEETPAHVRIAEWLGAKKVPRWVVAVLGILPLIPLGYLTGQYIALVANVICAM